jgi:hypothetical protein
MVPHGIGDYVKYADHVAAVAEAERGRSEWAQTNWDQGYAAGQRDTVQGHPIESCTSSYEQGQRDAIAKAIAAVDARLEELRWVAIPKGESRVDAVKREVIAALKAVGGE